MRVTRRIGTNDLNEAQKALLARFLSPLSTAVLQMQLLEDVLSLEPDYPSRLLERLEAAIEVASDRLGRPDDLDEDEAADPDSVPFECLDGREEQRDVWELADLFHSLTLGASRGSQALVRATIAGQVVAICSALESLADDLEVPKRTADGKSIALLNRITEALDRGAGERLGRADQRRLGELIEIRNLIVHERGRLSAQLWNRTTNTAQIPGDDLVLDESKFFDWLRFVEAVGTKMIRAAT
jgi:hypothetical protein